MGKITRNPFQKFLVLLLFIGTTYSVSGQTCPGPDPLDILNPIVHEPGCFIDSGDCTSKDLELVGAFLDVGDTCNSCDEGETVTAELFLSINNTTGSTRTSFAIFGNLEVVAPDGTTILCPISRCTGDIPGNQITTLSYGSISFTCGEELTLKDMVLSWTDASPNSTCGNHDCQEISPKCGSVDEIVITPPLSATATAECNNDNTADVDLKVMGGQTPFTFSWTGPNGFTASTEDLNSVEPGVYTVDVMDANNCMTTTTVTVPVCFICPTLNNESPDLGTCIDDQGQTVSVDTDVDDIDIEFVWFTSAQANPYVGGTLLGTAVTPAGGTATSNAGINFATAGTYYVYAILDTDDPELTDPNCRPFAEIEIVINELPVAEIVVTDALCFGELTGSVDLTVTGGTTAYNYSWDNGATTEDLTGVAAGTYNVTITDANGCETTASATVNEPAAALTCSIALDSGVTVNGASDGSATVTALGGTTAYSYLWDNGETTQQATGLNAGLHTVTVTDANGCETECEVTIPQPDELVCSVALVQDEQCFGDEDGSATANPVGGVAPFTYLWDNGETVQTAIGLAQGLHTVTVTDANGATTDCEITIGGPSAALTCSIALDSGVTVNGASDGSATVTALGGTTAYSYLWDNGETTQQATGLNAGLHTVTVTDANGCETECEVTIPQPDVLSCSVALVQDEQCFGDEDGSGTANPVGGVAPFTYLWDNGETVQTAIGLAQGLHTVTVTDANGATTDCEITIGGPLAALTCSIALDSGVTVNGASDGSATVTALDGTPGYTYLWDNNETTQTATALDAGLHTVTVTDANGCETECEVTIPQPDVLSCSVALVQDEQCFGDEDGSGTANPVGGVAPFTYLWDNGETVQTAIGLTQGLHTVTVTDANGATTDCEITIGGPLAALSCSIALDSGVTVNGASDGSATVTAEDGTPGYTYLWDNNETTQTATALDAGLHTVTVTDANGCETECEVTIPQPDVLSCSVALVNNVLCFEDSTGSATANPVGGVAPFTYLWDNGETVQTAIALNAGLHTVTVTDANGATTDCEITITEPKPADAGADDSITVCDGTIVDLTLLVTVAGGSFSEAIVTGGLDGTNFDTTGLSPGTYEVIYTVEAGDTCPVNTAIITINVDPPVDAGGDKELAVCESTVIDLSTLVDVAGGTFTPQGGGLSGSILDTSGFASGDYIYTYTVGSNGTCPDDTATITIMISEDIIDKECKVIDADFCTPNEDPFYNFYWFEMKGVSGSSFFSQDATHTLNFTQFNNGTALITGMTQQNGCSVELYIFLEDKKDWTQWTADGGTYKPQGCAGTIKEQMQYYVIDGSRSWVKTTGSCVEEGTYIITQRPDPNDLSTPNLGVHVGPGGALWDSNQGAEGLAGWAWMGPQGDEQRWKIDFNFLLDCEEKVGCIIDDPDRLDCEIAANVEDVSCNGGNDGSATVMVTGGLPPYSYAWSNGETSMTAINLTEGTHTVTVTDSENTITECSVTIEQPVLLECTVALVNGISAIGVNDGSATVTPTGGTADFTYLWENNETTQTATSLGAGTHMVTVTDANGCETSCSVDIPIPGMLACEATGTDVSCYDGSDGTATVTPIGGLAPYSYSWSNGDTTQSITGLAAGTYDVTVSDANGRDTNCEVEIAQPLEDLTCTALAFLNVSTTGGSDGKATVTPAGGTLPYTYLWDNGETAAMAEALDAGVHTVTVTDANGCMTECSVEIMQPIPNALECEATGTDVSCYDGSDGTATVTPMGGLVPYTYSWSNGDTTQSITGLAAGTYDVTVSDANGRDTNCEVEISQPLDLSCVAMVSGNVSTTGGSDGKATVTPEGGTLPYTYLWDNGETAAMAEALDVGVHTVTVTDANGCMTECSVEIMQPIPNALECEATGTNVACYDGTNGTATVTPMGGLAPYSYSWSNGDTTQSITGLEAGTYEVTVSDANGRDTNCEVEILQPMEDLSCLITDVVNSNEGQSNGEATASPSGGTAPYTYLWNDSQAQTTATATGLAPDSYTVTTTDANGCETSCMITIEEIPDGGPVTGCETAFARDQQTNTCFLDDGFNRWGWTNYFANEGDYMLDLYSGAGQCNLNSGEKSGNVQVAYNGGSVTVTIELLDGFVMQEAHLYVGGVKYPTSNNGRTTVAPGQFPYKAEGLNDLTTYQFDPVNISGGIHVIVHVNTCKKSNDAGRVVKTAVTAYPMTFKNDLNLKVDIPYDAQLKVEMFDVNGRCILSKKGMNVKSGSNNVHLNVSSLSSDMYILIIDTGREKIMKKVLSKK